MGEPAVAIVLGREEIRNLAEGGVGGGVVVGPQRSGAADAPPQHARLRHQADAQLLARAPRDVGVHAAAGALGSGDDPAEAVLRDGGGIVRRLVSRPSFHSAAGRWPRAASCAARAERAVEVKVPQLARVRAQRQGERRRRRLHRVADVAAVHRWEEAERLGGERHRPSEGLCPILGVLGGGAAEAAVVETHRVVR